MTVSRTWLSCLFERTLLARGEQKPEGNKRLSSLFLLGGRSALLNLELYHQGKYAPKHLQHAIPLGMV